MKNPVLRIKNSIFKILIELFVFDKKKRSIIKARFAKRHLEKYVDIALNSIECEDDFETAFGPKAIKIAPGEEIIWQYWHQGIENAPDLIKKCFESVERFESSSGAGHRVAVLSFDTVKDYIKLPEIYYKLVKSGKMKIALFSDIVRLYLLRQYGGAWIDSTILLTDKISENVWNSDFCVVQKDVAFDPQENRMSCYFIRAKKGCKNVAGILKALEHYWAENDFLVNYFMFEHISTMLYDKNPKLKSEWDNMPYINACDCGELQNIMFENFDNSVWERVKSKTNIHKLSYKILKDTTSGKSYYDWIMEGKAS